ncbi:MULTISPECIES: DNA polymerase ligase N-terminal domain-containing protein [unclassified Pseudofrankia]|uniref:DNA polymerase ligase N-terminal domain-containing protein n=1 Tax=unclassified Pseudofrankia TaxID=2994372 RepID=UPI0008DA70C9|nr:MULTISPECIES: DNA polymerase ligase N-terminal domain-containing protein [unclassified Pseudofrankia]MDT3445044.1 DNA polymerase ligase N-terminal domain-containing protein [Pseudofrankia sp. BMG5.37]OHV47193.1 ATP-dependent DNA ligase [Pseudofrankia sp. BMG5.36]
MTGEEPSPLDAYRARRDQARTPEPVPAAHPENASGPAATPGETPEKAPGDTPGETPGGGDRESGVVDHTGDDQAGRGDTFVIQEHHARALHWDVRLERDGVLVSWAVPKGLPVDPHTNHLAKQTEDHPLEYAGFAGDIPRGEYGGGSVKLWDRGTYELESWTADKVKVVLHGERVRGRYVFFRAGGRPGRETGATGAAGRRRGAPYGPDDWMVHRMDPPQDPTREPMPAALEPMYAVAGPLPSGPEWVYEVKWDGMRVLAFIEGGRVRARSRAGRDVTAAFPELRPVGAALGATQAVLDGEIVAFGPDGRPDFSLLAHRIHVADAGAARRLARQIPVSYLVFDLLFLEGHATTGLSFDERRDLLAQFPGLTLSDTLPGDGPEVLRASAAAGLEGVIAKRRSSVYQPGRRAADWVKTKNIRTQTVVIGGWEPGAGRREGRIGSLLVGIADPGVADPGGPRLGGARLGGAEGGETGGDVGGGIAFRYAGHVGTGFSDATLDLLASLLEPLRQDTPPFPDVPAQRARKAVWVRPELVAEVEYAHWTPDARMRHPSFKGLRDDLTPADTARDPSPIGEAGPMA